MIENNTVEDSISSDAEGGVSGERLYPIYAARICAELINNHPKQVDINVLSYIVHPEMEELPNEYERGENRHKISPSTDRFMITAASYKPTQSNIEEATAAQRRLTIYENQGELQRIVRGTMLSLIKSDIVYAPHKDIEYFEEVRWEYRIDKCKLTPNGYTLLVKEFSGEMKEIYDKYRAERNLTVAESNESNAASVLKSVFGGAGGIFIKGTSKATEEVVCKSILSLGPLALNLLGFSW